MKLKPMVATGSMVVIILIMTATFVFPASDQPSPDKESPQIEITGDVGKAAKREAAKIKDTVEKRARVVFQRVPIGWNFQTIRYLYEGIMALPSKMPELFGKIIAESRILGVMSSLVILSFIAAVIYSLYFRKAIINWIELYSRPFSRHIPKQYYPHFLALVRVVTTALIPLILLALYTLIHKLIAYHGVWFLLGGKLLLLWVSGAVVLRIMKEILTRNLFETTSHHGKTVYHYLRLFILYMIIGIGASWGVNVFKVRNDVVALIRFAVALMAIAFVFSLLLKKKTFLSLLPAIDHRGFRWLSNFLNTFYYPLLFISLAAALLWCVGYAALGKMVLFKLWATIGAILSITLIHYHLRKILDNRARHLTRNDESGRSFIRSLKSILFYISIVFTLMVVLDILGILYPLTTLMSFSIFRIGETQITPWIILKALVVLLAFVLTSRLLQNWLDYKVYPVLGIDPGLGYALNTFFKYLTLIIGFFISISLVGIDLRFLLVFAGAAGIGIGLGLQNLTTNVISGFTIIFGGKVRKGDWIEVSERMGVVSDIYLRATKVRTRDNIEYLIPNSDLISNTIINYSLSSPLIRIELPIGVSYAANPRRVEEIVIAVAEKEPMVSNFEKPQLRFVEYGDSAINFELLVWIDVRTVPRRKLRSALYYAIFDEFRKTGIEIPFPQRDIHIRSKGEGI